MTRYEWYCIALALSLASLYYLIRKLIRFARGPAPIPREYAEESPTLPPAIIIHLAVSDRVAKRIRDEEEEALRDWQIMKEIEELTA